MIEVLKQALEALNNFANGVRYDNEYDEIGSHDCCGALSYNPHSESCKATKAIASINQAIKELESQEPSGHFLDFAYSDSIAYVHVYDQFRKGQQFYKAPPQRTWVGLTNEDIGDEYVRFEIQGGFNKFEYAVKAIEAKLKEKNNA